MNKYFKEDKKVYSWFDNNSMFSCIDEYNEFIEGIKYAAENNILPLTIQHKKPFSINTMDIIEFCERVKISSGLNTEFIFTTCDCCNELQCLIIIDKPEV